MFSITTKQGDSGDTRLYSGETVNKKSVRIGACGDIDELVSFLGVAYATIDMQDTNSGYHIAGDNSPEFIKQQQVLQELEYIQKTLFDVASEIATLEPRLSKLPNRINEDALALLDRRRDALEANVELPKGFVLPGANLISSHLDVCRSVSRRCERTITGLYNEGIVSNKYLLMWMNRLSDYLYLLARYVEDNKYRMVKTSGEDSK